MNQRCLLVGGTHDGEWHELDTRREIIELVERVSVDIFDRRMSSAEATEEYKRAIYQRHRWRIDEKEFTLYARMGMDGREIFERLLSGYKPARALQETGARHD